MSKRKGSVRILSVLLACLLACSLAACSAGLSGTYTSQDGLVEQSITFKQNNVVEMSAFGINISGTYALEGDKLIITYSLLNLSYDWERTFEMDGNTITIDGVKFVKE